MDTNFLKKIVQHLVQNMLWKLTCTGLMSELHWCFTQKYAASYSITYNKTGFFNSLLSEFICLTSSLSTGLCSPMTILSSRVPDRLRPRTAFFSLRGSNERSKTSWTSSKQIWTGERKNSRLIRLWARSSKIFISQKSLISIL